MSKMRDHLIKRLDITVFPHSCASLQALSVICLLPVINHGRVIRPPHGPNKYIFTTMEAGGPLRKHAYSNILNLLPPKYEKFQMKNSANFHISAQNKDCGYSLQPFRRGGSNESPQSMFLSRNKKNNVYPCNPQFYYIKVGIKGVKII